MTSTPKIKPSDLAKYEGDGTGLNLASIWGVGTIHEVWEQYSEPNLVFYIVRPMTGPSAGIQKWNKTAHEVKVFDDPTEAILHAVKEASNEVLREQDRALIGKINVVFDEGAAKKSEPKQAKITVKDGGKKKKGVVKKKTAPKPKAKPKAAPKPKKGEGIIVGAKVRYNGEIEVGKVTDVKRKNATVNYGKQLGEFDVPIAELIVAS